MNKLDVSSPILTLAPVAEFAHRLIVLVPNLEVDLTAVAHRVWALANATDAHVQFIGLYSDAAQEPSLRRELVTMSGMVKDDRVSTEVEAILGNDWVDVVKTHYQAGDLVLCFAEHRTGLSRRPLSEILQSELNMPVYILSELYPRNDSHSNLPAQITAWAGLIAIIFGCLVLQVKIGQLAKDWTHTLLLFLSIPFEVWMIWIWNSLFE
jgi:hypothetical protein